MQRRLLWPNLFLELSFGKGHRQYRASKKKSTLKRTILALVMNKGRTEHNILEMKDTSAAQIILSYTRNTVPSYPTSSV